MNLNVDKRNWKKVKLDDVCEWYQKNIPNDEQFAYGIKYYVTANHIDTDSIKFDRYNELQDGQKGPTITKHFEKGDLLLSTRSVALRKAALAPISGVTGEKLLVLRVKQESALLKEFMPFLFQSVDFWEYAQNSASGSVNKFTSWTKIREYEFLLPPKDQQAKLAELLWAMDEVIEGQHVLLSQIEQIKKIESLNAFMNGKQVNRVDDIKLPDNTWKLIPLKEVVPDIEYGISISIPSNQNPLGIPIISTAEIDREGNLDYSIIRSINYAKMNERVTLRSGDVLFNWRNSAELIGKSTIYEQPLNDHRDYTFASFILRMRCDEVFMHNKYLKHLFNFYRVSEIFLGLARRAVNQANFNKNEVYDLKIPVPPYKTQLKIMKRLNQVEETKRECLDKISNSKSLQKSLINQVF